jgi:hypothetical protein
MASADLDGDGRPELLLGGVNDALEYKQATIVILDPWNISGASKNPKGGTYFQGMAPGTEKKVVFFPRSELSRNIEFNRVVAVRVAADRITVNVAEGTSEDAPDVVYEFDFRLRLITVMLSNPAMDQYRQLWDSGKLAREPFSMITERLKAGIILV